MDSLHGDDETHMYRIGKYAAALIIFGNQHIMFKDRETENLFKASRNILVDLLQKYDLSDNIKNIPDISGPGGYNLFIEHEIESNCSPPA
jgi:hypothetical protein